MATSHIRNTLKRSALTVALGMCFASPLAMAQSAVGSVFGTADAGNSVVIENEATGVRREVTAGTDGRFSFTQLAPGTYKVTTNGVTRVTVVRVGTGSQVSFGGDDATNVDAIVVTGSSLVNSIDVSSVESTTVFTAAQMERIPVARDITNVALLAPGTVKGDTGFGNLASFGGSSVAENGYYINGFDVTNIRNFVAYSTLPFESISEQQIKTGGYGAEYGRSLGGVVSVVTKRGTNEWKGGVSAYWRPSWGRAEGKDVISRNPTDFTSGDYLHVYRSDNESDSVYYNAYVGGPIVKDRLFVFGMAEFVNEESNAFGRITSSRTRNTEPNGMIKLDWNISENHVAELTAIRDKTKDNVLSYSYAPGQKYVGEHQLLDAEQNIENGGDIFIGKYTGYLTDNFTISAQAGKLTSVNGYTTPEFLPGGECVRAYDSTANASQVVYTGCWNQAQTFIRDPNFGPDEDERKGYRLDAEWRLGDHFLRMGWDKEEFNSGHAGQTYTGGGYWRHYRVTQAAGRTVNGTLLPFGTTYSRLWINSTTSGSFGVENEALYLEDNWQVTDNFLAYLGLRTESFNNTNADGDTFVEASHKIAPRLGFSWDVRGDSTLKLYGNAGRYYIPVASNTNIRASGAELFTEQYFRTTGFDRTTGLPTGLGAQIGQTNVNGDGVAPNPATVAATNLSPMYQDEFILGMQMDLGNNWIGGVKGVFRKVKDGMDDFCSVQPFQDWADDNGYANFDYHSLASCFMLNPGRDVGIALDLQGDGNLTNVTIPASYFGMPQYQREYKAVEFLLEKATENWSLQASYTWAKSTGNVEGYVNSSLEQDDAGLTQDFDNKVFEDGAYGNLPNDRRHTIKAFGSIKLSEEWRVGTSLIVASGRPVNCLGFAPVGNDLDSGTLAFYGASSFYCKKPDGTTVLENRGSQGRTPWTWSMDASVSYTPVWAGEHLSFKLTAFNVFNMQRVTEYNEVSASGSATSNVYNPNFLNDVNYQAPRSLELSARYEF